MKAQELNLEKQGFTMSANIHKAGSHTSMLINLGRLLPTTKAQAKKFNAFDVLNFDDVQLIESILNKHGYSGNYQYTKSKQWVRLTNTTDFVQALKKEYKF